MKNKPGKYHYSAQIDGSTPIPETSFTGKNRAHTTIDSCNVLFVATMWSPCRTHFRPPEDYWITSSAAPEITTTNRVVRRAAEYSPHGPARHQIICRSRNYNHETGCSLDCRMQPIRSYTADATGKEHRFQIGRRTKNEKSWSSEKLIDIYQLNRQLFPRHLYNLWCAEVSIISWNGIERWKMENPLQIISTKSESACCHAWVSECFTR